ncbi:phosphoglycerate dehydrogenase [Phenylobacterium sp.]|uniref:phosphoglycerate dehydrogenase n=1 Tax=Phenylobacterium sp. TaxID=1871053 RepID=UPI00272FA44A|nr:phosphoglycerate dehydrogenase [Phenylobacterium sp.]MDP2212855.1 phosphoglycerate dehydrogenase [Phenylobacterium sp.]
MARNNRRVVVTQRFFDEAAVAYLEAAGCEVVIADLPPGQADGGLDHDELAALLSSAQGWIVGHAKVTRFLLMALPHLAVISRRGVGYERVDLEAAAELGRVVTIAAGGNDASVADQAIGMMIALGRRFREAQAQMNAGAWSILTGSDLYRKTVGVVGLGRIGRGVVQRLSGFEAEVLVATSRLDPEYAARTGVTYADLDALLARSDYLTLHAPLTPATRHMINAAAIARMRPGAFLINTARGGLVSDADLLAALQAGRLRGAGLDVFESEADPALQPVTDALIARPDVVAAPHAGASTREGLARTNMIAARCVVAVLNGENPPAECVVADGRQPVGQGA